MREYSDQDPISGGLMALGKGLAVNRNRQGPMPIVPSGQAAVGAVQDEFARAPFTMNAPAGATDPKADARKALIESMLQDSQSSPVLANNNNSFGGY
jgi:hypothetical protein